jgi:glycosyltransferase involved in cell wall biosynthesis
MYQPILTIAIPTFNRALLLDKCFGSILSQIDDDIKKDIELIVLNNDSHDNTDEIVSKYIDK